MNTITLTLRRISLSALLMAVITVVNAGTPVADIPNVHVADRTRYVSNPDGVLSADAVRRLDTTLGKIWESTSAEPVVVAVASMPGDTDIDTYATDIFDAWGIGKKDKDNGVLMVIARDDRKAVIRTGRGAEGVLPDIVCGRILRNEMFPRFREGDYDGGTEAALAAMERVLTDPQYAAELRSEQPNDAHAGESDLDGEELFSFYLKIAALLALVMTAWAVGTVWTTRRNDSVYRYSRLHQLLLPALVVTFLTLGMGLPALLIGYVAMKRTRSKRKCPNCHHAMKKIDEQNDNAYLTPAQDTEEKINSVDYDVWVCPNCRETDILPYVNRRSAYRVCDRCGSRASALVMDRVVLRPTERRKGAGERTYRCKNCGNTHVERYVIPMLAAAAPVIIGGIGGRGGGGGFSGGSFGGGITGGGGASGGW